MKLTFLLLATIFSCVLSRSFPEPLIEKCSCPALLGSGFEYTAGKCSVKFSCNKDAIVMVDRVVRIVGVHKGKNYTQVSPEMFTYIGVPLIRCDNSAKQWKFIDWETGKARHNLTHANCDKDV